MLRSILVAAALLCIFPATYAAPARVEVQSPDRRNAIILQSAVDGLEHVQFSIVRDGRPVIQPSRIGPVIAGHPPLCQGARVLAVRHGHVDDSLELQWSKTSKVRNDCSYAVVTLRTEADLQWIVELRAYDDGVAFRYRLPRQEGLNDCQVTEEVTRFNVAGNPMVLFNPLSGFTSSHESLYQHKQLSDVPAEQLVDMPMLFTWRDGPAAAITEARVLGFAGAYLERQSTAETTLRCRLSPHPADDGVCVAEQTPLVSPWRVIMLSDVAGELLESNLLLCLNDPPRADFDWLRAGKTTWHWWYGEFEDDYQLPQDSNVSFERHKKYIDFCAANQIAFHAVSGDGRTWYQQSGTGYGTPAADADVRAPRPEIQLPRILKYAREQGVGIRLWVHWKPLSEHLEEAFALYESWGVQGLMVDFLNRDDQQMIDFTEQMLDCAAQHKLHLQIHGSSKFSGEQRTFPHLFNREGVLNLEFLKWSDLCTPAHNVNVAFTRGLTGPVDYHQGGFRSVSRAVFKHRDRAPVVMGTRCHHLALYVVYENPMPMVADAPSAYEGQPGFEFIAEVPTTWDETRFLAGEPAEYIVVARRKADTWYIGGITNWTQRTIHVPFSSLGDGTLKARMFVDGSMDESQPNKIRRELIEVSGRDTFEVSLAPGGGFVAVVRPE